MYQGFSHFSGCLPHFLLAKLATGSIRVKVVNYTLNVSFSGVNLNVIRFQLIPHFGLNGFHVVGGHL